MIAAHHVQLCTWVVADVMMIGNSFRMRVQSVVAVDAMIGKLQQAAAAIGAADDTLTVGAGWNGRCSTSTMRHCWTAA